MCEVEFWEVFFGVRCEGFLYGDPSLVHMLIAR